MVWKKASKDIKSNGGSIIPKGELCEVVDVWLNNLRNDFYVKLKTKDGGFIITSIKSLELINKEE